MRLVVRDFSFSLLKFTTLLNIFVLLMFYKILVVYVIAEKLKLGVKRPLVETAIVYIGIWLSI